MRFAEPSQIPGFELRHDDVVHAGVPLRVFRFPDGLEDAARAVVCLHGMSASGASFARLRPLAARWDFRLVSAPVDGYPGESVDALSRAIGSYLGVLEKPVLLGTSWGGLVALRAAMDAGERLSALVLVGGFAYNSRLSGPLAFMRRMVPVTQRWAPRVARVSAAMVGGSGLDREGRDELVRESREVPAAERTRRLRAVFATDLRPELGRIRVPAIVIHGTSDMLVSAGDARELAAGIPGCEYVEIERAGHVPYMTRADELVPILRSFLDRHTPRVTT